MPLFEIIQKAQSLGQKLIITTDHGTINCKHPTKVIGDKNISANLRYKTGRSLSYEEKDVFAVKNPKVFESWIDTYGSERIILGADCNNEKITRD